MEGPKVRNDFLTLEVIRPLDLLKLTIQFYNCKYQKRDQLTFVVKDKRNQPCFMVIKFPSRHTLEQAFLEADNPANNETPSLHARFIRAGSSRLVYELPIAFQGVPLTMDYLLDWSSCKLKVSFRARIKLAQVVTQAFGQQQLKLKGKKILQNYRYIQEQNISNRKLNIAENPKYKLDQSRKYDQRHLQKVVAPDEMLRINEDALAAVRKKNTSKGCAESRIGNRNRSTYTSDHFTKSAQ